MSRLNRVANKGAQLVRRWLGVLRDDLWTARTDPLPPSTWLRWLPHGIVCLAAFGVLAGGLPQMQENGGLAFGPAFLVAVCQAGAMVYALRRPVPAWWLSMAATLVGAVLLHRRMIADETTFTWPWTASGIVAHLFVLLLLALRVPTRVSVEAWGLTFLLTYLLQGVWGAVSYQPTGQVLVPLSAVVVILGTALRGRREARVELGRQTTITAEERARRTLLEERSRIARELHDVVAHHMSVISIQAQVAPHLTRDPSDELRENLAGIRQNAVEALTELRRVLDVLRSEHPGPGEVSDAPQPTLDRLEALVENTRAAGLTVTTEITGGRRRLPSGVELSAYRIVQEALSNSLRHAPGASARVEIGYVLGGLGVRVVNGPAPEPSLVKPSPGAGHGITGMRERVTMLNGEMTAGPADDGGYEVAVFLPVATVNEGDA